MQRADRGICCPGFTAKIDLRWNSCSLLGNSCRVQIHEAAAPDFPSFDFGSWASPDNIHSQIRVNATLLSYIPAAPRVRLFRVTRSEKVSEHRALTWLAAWSAERGSVKSVPCSLFYQISFLMEHSRNSFPHNSVKINLLPYTPEWRIAVIPRTGRHGTGPAHPVAVHVLVQTSGTDLFHVAHRDAGSTGKCYRVGTDGVLQSQQDCVCVF